MTFKHWVNDSSPTVQEGERFIPLKSHLKEGERSLTTGLLIATDWVKDRYRLGERTFTPSGT